MAGTANRRDPCQSRCKWRPRWRALLLGSCGSLLARQSMMLLRDFGSDSDVIRIEPGNVARNLNNSSLPFVANSNTVDMVLRDKIEITSPASMVLIRTIGNAFSPRQSAQDEIDKLKYILDNEPSFPNCVRTWFLNRITDPQKEKVVVDLLNQYGEKYTIVPFDLLAYKSIRYRYDLQNSWTGLAEASIPAVYQDKMAYATNLNGVRNAMIAYGKQNTSAEYILPWDGNSYLTQEAWEAIQHGISLYSSNDYYFVPMDHIHQQNRTWQFGSQYTPAPVADPQIIFSRKSSALFDSTEISGRLNRLENKTDQWDETTDLASEEKIVSDVLTKPVPRVGWVASLQLGPATDDVISTNNNIRSFLEELDTRVVVAETQSRPLFRMLTPKVNISTRSTSLSQSPEPTEIWKMIFNSTLEYLSTGSLDAAKAAGDAANKWVSAGLSLESWGNNGTCIVPLVVSCVAELEKIGGMKPEISRFRSGLKQSLQRLVHAAHNTKSRKIMPSTYSGDNGLCFDLQIAAAAHFVGENKFVVPAVHRALARFESHLKLNGNAFPEFLPGPDYHGAWSMLRQFGRFASATLGDNLAAPLEEEGDDDEIKAPVSLILLRALGNALPPRHSPTQTLENLQFTLKKEKLFPNMTRHWMVNRIVDPTVEREVIHMLETYGESYTVVTFNASEYSDLPFGFHRAEKLYGMPSHFDFAIHLERLQYSINVNGIRNSMLDYGITNSSAEFILPWDGNCFVTEKAWQAIQRGIKKRRSYKYFFVPMDRLKVANKALLSRDYKPNAIEEPQVIFSRHATARFNPLLAYGNRNKMELFNRLETGQAEGDRRWSSWERVLVSQMSNANDTSEGMVPRIGWVHRLFSGAPRQETDRRRRGRLRELALEKFLRRLGNSTVTTNTGRMLDILSDRVDLVDNPKAYFESAKVQLEMKWDKNITWESESPWEMQDAVIHVTKAFRITRHSQLLSGAARIVDEWLDMETDNAFPLMWARRNTTNFPEFLVAVHELHRKSVLSEPQMQRIRIRFENMIKFLIKDCPRKKVRNNYAIFGDKPGLWFDVQVAAVGLFLRNRVEYQPALYRAVERMDRLWKANNETALPAFVLERPCTKFRSPKASIIKILDGLLRAARIPNINLFRKFGVDPQKANSVFDESCTKDRKTATQAAER